MSETIAKKLERIDELAGEMDKLLSESLTDFIRDSRIIRTAERDFQLIVDLASDINTEIIIKEGGRTPDTYKDSFQGIEKLGVIERELAQKLVEAARVRNILVHEYDFEEDYEKFYASAKKLVPSLREYAKVIYNYISRTS